MNPIDRKVERQINCTLHVQATDIFSLGTIFYTILMGYWPCRNNLPLINQERFTYEDQGGAVVYRGQIPRPV
jgi:hypothetical protein